MSLLSRPVHPLPKLTTTAAEDLAATANVHPASQVLLKSGMTPSEYIQALEEHGQSVDATKVLAHGMSDRHGVWWASQSSRKVADKLNPEEHAAMQAAEAWVKDPSETTKAAAAAAASKTDFKGPGGWAAQAAAWSQPGSTAPKAPGQGAGPTTEPFTPALTAAAVAGAVMLAAGLANQPAMAAPKKPEPQVQPAALAKTSIPFATEVAAKAPPKVPSVDQSKMAKPLSPFIALGKDIARGKNTWV